MSTGNFYVIDGRDYSDYNWKITYTTSSTTNESYYNIYFAEPYFYYIKENKKETKVSPKIVREVTIEI